MADVKFARGTQAQYNAKLDNSQIDDNTIYYIDDVGRVYLGTKLMDGGSGNTLHLVLQDLEDTIRDGAGLQINGVDDVDIYNIFRSAPSCCFLLTVSGNDDIVFTIGELNLANNSVYMYAFKDQKMYYITLTTSGNNMVGVLHITDFVYPNGDGVSY